MLAPTEPAIKRSTTLQATRPLEYTMQDIHNAIPKHCFERDTLRSIRLVARDYAMVFVLLVCATLIPYIGNTPVRVLAWSTYGFCQGLIFTGLWELAHESGHGALSKQKWVNNAIGLLIHSTLLVPYYSWQYTHRTHHKGTNHLDRDIAFMPEIQDPPQENDNGPLSFFAKAHDMVMDCPLTSLITLFFHQLIAFPIYLTLNNFALARMRKFAWWKRSHFYLGGDGPNFRPEQAKSILISDLCVGGMMCVLWTLTRIYGRWNVMLFYGLPYLWSNHWICEISLLDQLGVSQIADILNSDHYIPTTHRRSSSILLNSVLVVPSRRRIHHRPRFWHHRTLPLPRDRRDTCTSPSRRTHSVLSCSRSYGRYSESNGRGIPRGHEDALFGSILEELPAMWLS